MPVSIQRVIHHPVVRKTHRFAHAHAHETAVAAIPLLWDFKFWVFTGSIFAVIVLYIVEQFIIRTPVE